MTDDIYSSADEAQLPTNTYYGQIDLNMWYCILVKGAGKVLFDETQHKMGQRCTAVDIAIIPIAQAPLPFSLERNIIAESRAWISVTWPSLRDLGLSSSREAKGRWCKCVQAPTGRKWRDKKTNEERQETSFKFLALYDSEEACVEAYYADTGKEPEETQEVPGFESSNGEKGQAMALIKSLWGANPDRNQLNTFMLDTPLVDRHYPGGIANPEIAAYLQTA